MKMNTKHFRQYIIVILTVFLTLVELFEKPQEVYAVQPELNAINVWTSENMKVYYNSTEFHEAPQILYLANEEGGLHPLFCVEYGKAAHTGDLLNWVAEENYNNLNEKQKVAVSYVLGSGAEMNPPSEDGLGYRVDYTNAVYQAQMKKFWSTQLMIWYYIDKYADNPGAGNTGGITWAGVEATCNEGWGDLTECNRIWYAVEAINQLPSFSISQDVAVEIPTYEMTYNSASGMYEILLENTNTQCSLNKFSFPEGTGLQYQFSNADGTANDNGNYLKISSSTVILPEEATTVTATYEPRIGDLWYITNTTSEQSLLACYGTKSGDVTFKIKAYTRSLTDLSISKQDITTQTELPGCTLAVTSTDGGITYDTWVSGSVPHLITGLESGTYVLKELIPADGYTLANSITFSYDKNSNTAQSVIMYNSRSRVELLKTDETGNPLAGAKLEVRKADGSLVESWTSGSTAHVIEGLPAGNYILKETEAPSGYTIAADKAFTVTQANQTVTVTMADKKTRVELLKTDETGNPLAGAKLEVRKADGSFVESWTSGTTAHVIEGLPAGNYILKETEAPSGYTIAADKPFTVTQLNQTVTVTMTDKEVRGKLRVYKTGDQIISATEYTSVYGSFHRLDFAQKPLAGAVFALYRADGTFIEYMTTGSDGYAESSYLEWGDYYLIEVKTQNGLVNNQEKIPVSLLCPDNYHESIYYADAAVTNEVGDTEINVYKQGEILNVDQGTYSFGKKPLPGVIFGVYTAKDILDYQNQVVLKADSCIGFIKTGEDGKATLRDALCEGEYYYKEVQTVDGYILDTTRKDFTLMLGNTELNTMDVNKENPDVNKLYKTRLQITKSDSADSNVVLSGVEFQLYNEKDELMGTYVTDESGRIIIDNLPYGSYYFVETKAADGYVIDTSPHRFTADTETMNLDVTNAKQPDTPQTGDSVPVGMLIAFMTGAFSFGIACLWPQKKRS